MAFTPNFAILNDFPLFWEPAYLERNAHVARFHRDMPSRFAVIPRRGTSADIKWFEADPTYVLHFTNAFEDGDEVVLDGFFQGDPEPTDNGLGDKWQRAFRFLALDRMQARLHRWRFNLVTGATHEEQLSDSITEFGMINPGHAGGGLASVRPALPEAFPDWSSISWNEDFHPALSAGIRNARSTCCRGCPGRYSRASVSATVMPSGPDATLIISCPASTAPSVSTRK